MLMFETFADAYRAGLAKVLEVGRPVPSVVDPLSKASNFGEGDRPYHEIIAHSFAVRNPARCIVDSTVFPVNLAYCFGLLAWSLDGRDDVATLAYYRRGALEYSDDQHTLSGAFGRRLLAAPAGGDQLRAIVNRILKDPSHRRTFATIMSASDNFASSREYPCAVGVQLFLRDGALTWLTVMRAQQAFTVLPYDAFLFMALHQLIAASMGVAAGPYLHQSGTFHIYDNELEPVRRLVDGPMTKAALPDVLQGRLEVEDLIRDLIRVERDLREAAERHDVAAIDRVVTQDAGCAYLDTYTTCLANFAYRRVSSEALARPKHDVPAELVGLLS
jgi:thymidylate synthase